MQIIEKAKKFYYDNEELVWDVATIAAVGVYCAYLGGLFGYAKGFNKGLKNGCDASEALMQMMEPEAYARMCKTAEAATKILSK